MNQKGFVNIILIVFVVVIIAVGAMGYFTLLQKEKEGGLKTGLETILHPQTAPDEKMKWKTYTEQSQDDRYGFQFQYPEDWSMQQERGKLPKKESRIVLYLNNKQQVDFKNHKISLDLEQEDNSFLVEYVKSGKSIADPNASSSIILVGGRETVLLKFTYTEPSDSVPPRKAIVYEIIIPLEEHTLFLQSPVAYKSTLDQILSTFKFTNPISKTYRNNEYGFEMKYPGNYILYENKSSPLQTTEVTFFEDTAENRQFVEVLNKVSAVQLDQAGPPPSHIGVDVFTAVDSQQPQIPSLTPLEWAKETWYPNLGNGSFTSLNVAGVDAISYSFSGLQKGDAKGDAVVLRKNDNIFALTVTYSDPDAPVRKDFKKILSTFKFIELTRKVAPVIERTPILTPTINKVPVTQQPPPAIQTPSSETANWKTYRNEAYGFEVKHPASWSVVKENTDIARRNATYYTVDRVEVAVFNEKSGSNVTVIYLGTSLNFSDRSCNTSEEECLRLWDKHKLRLDQFMEHAGRNESFQNVKKTLLNGYNAYEIDSKGTGQFSIMLENKEGEVFAINFTNGPTKIDLSPTELKMLPTFKFIR